jgi:hypothetical protein
MNGKKIAAKLHEIGNVISGALKSIEILKKLAAFGYTTERINEGKALLEKVNQLMIAQVKKYGKQYAATDAQEKFLESAYASYMVTVKTARIAFKKHLDILAGLGITGKRSRSLSGWLRRAKILYTNLFEMPDALDMMINFGYTAERLQKELQDIEEVEKLHIEQLSGKSEAQQATQQRDEAFDELCDWYSDFRGVARIALYDDPQLLEALGIVKK